MYFRLLFSLSLAGVALPAQTKDGPFPAHKVIGNVYYVGSQQLSSYLITTPQGHILINSSFEETVPLIRASIEKLGFNFGDMKILLTSHAHSDHVAGNARVKELTGAKVMVMQGDEDLVRMGGENDFQYSSRWRPCAVDRVLHDLEQVKLDGVTLTAHLTPGHTRGCTTWTLPVTEGAKTYQVVIVGSPNVNPGYKLVNNAKYQRIADDFARTFLVLKALPCDVFLGAHGEYYGLQDKYQKLQHGAPNPFIDPTGYRNFVESKEQEYLRKLAAQR